MFIAYRYKGLFWSLTPLNFGQSKKFEVKLLVLEGIFLGIFLGAILFVGDLVINQIIISQIIIESLKLGWCTPKLGWCTMILILNRIQ